MEVGDGVTTDHPEAMIRKAFSMRAQNRGGTDKYRFTTDAMRYDMDRSPVFSVRSPFTCIRP